MEKLIWRQDVSKSCVRKSAFIFDPFYFDSRDSSALIGCFSGWRWILGKMLPGALKRGIIIIIVIVLVPPRLICQFYACETEATMNFLFSSTFISFFISHLIWGSVLPLLLLWFGLIYFPYFKSFYLSSIFSFSFFISPRQLSFNYYFNPFKVDTRVFTNIWHCYLMVFLCGFFFKENNKTCTDGLC